MTCPDMSHVTSKNIIRKMKRYSILTFIIGEYEIVREVKHLDPEAEYILVTDNPDLKSDTWTVVYDKELASRDMSNFHKCMCIRYNPFRYCSTDICVRLDGSVQIWKSLKPLIDIFEEGCYDMSLMPHPERDNFIDEYYTWVHMRHYSPLQAIDNLEIMRKIFGYQFDYHGLFQLNYSIVRNTPEQNRLNENIYKLILHMGKDSPDGIERIDQIPFTLMVNLYHENYGLKVLPVSGQIMQSEYMWWCYHGNDILNYKKQYADNNEKDMKYMFDRPVECLKLL